MAGATVVALDLGVEGLAGLVPGDGAGDHMGAAVLAGKIHIKVGLGELVAVGHELFVDDQRGAVAEHRLGLAVGGVNTLDLGGLHLHVGVLGHFHHGGGVHDTAAAAVAGAVVLLDILDACALAHEEAVNAAVLAVGVAGVVDAAPRNDGDIAVGSDVEVVVDQLLDARLREDDGDVQALILGAGLDVDVDAGYILLLDDLNVLGGVLTLQLSVDAEGIGALGHFVEVSHLGQQLLLDGIESLLLLGHGSVLLSGCGGGGVTAARRGVEQLGQNLVLCADGADAAARDDHHLVGNVQDALLVRDDENGALLALVHLFEDLDEVLEAPEVNARLGLVEDRELGAAGVDHGDLDALELAAREGSIHLAVDIFLGAESDLGEILAGLAGGQRFARRQGDEVLDRDALEADGLLEGKADALACALGDGQVGDVLTVQNDLPLGGGDDARDDLGERGFAASVGAGDGHEAFVDGEVDIGEDVGLPMSAAGQILGDAVGDVLQF